MTQGLRAQKYFYKPEAANTGRPMTTSGGKNLLSHGHIKKINQSYSSLQEVIPFPLNIAWT